MQYPDPNDAKRWRQRSAIFDRKAEAQAWVTDALAEHRTLPGFRPPSGTTLGQFMDDWLSITSDRLRPSTVSLYRGLIRHLDGLAARPLRDLAPLEIQRLYAALRADQSKRLSARTVVLVHTLLHHALADAVSWGLINASPTSRIKAPRSQPPRLTVPALEEVARLLKTTEDHRLHTLWLWLALTGTRRGEALALRWADLSLQGRTAQATIQGTLSAAKVLGPTKTFRGARTLALPPGLAAALKEHGRRQKLERLAAGPAWTDSGLVFTTAKGTALGPRNVVRSFKAALVKAGLPQQIRVHDMRHAMATHWLASGVPGRVVSERLGHATVAFTLQVYGHVLPGQQAAAAEEMERDLLVRVRASSARTGEQGET